MEQDATIEDLNRTVTEQWRLIDRLARQLGHAAGSGGGGGRPVGAAGLGAAAAALLRWDGRRAAQTHRPACQKFACVTNLVTR